VCEVVIFHYMYLPSINLLSPEKRQHIRHMGTLQFFKSILEIGLVMLSVVSIILVGGWWILQQHFRDLTAQLTAVADTYAISNKKIHDVNEAVQQAYELQKRHTIWTPLLAEVSNALPSGIVLSHLTLNTSNNSIGFIGTAKTRDDLLRFETDIEELPFIGELIIPLNQLAEKENISFSLSAELVLDTDKKKK